MSLSQGALDAGAKAAIKVFTDAGYGSFVDMDKARGLAAPIIRAVDEYRAERERFQGQQAKPVPVPPPVDTKPAESGFAAFIRSVLSQLSEQGKSK